MLFNAILIAAITIRLYRDEKENKDLIWFDLIWKLNHWNNLFITPYLFEEEILVKIYRNIKNIIVYVEKQKIRKICKNNFYGGKKRTNKTDDK
jgi:hypothetical protein